MRVVCRPENGSIMPLLEAAQIASDGAPVADPAVPYIIVFQPDPATTALYDEVRNHAQPCMPSLQHAAAAVLIIITKLQVMATHKDMREALAQLKVGTTLYSMHLMDKGEDVSAGEVVGTIVTESEFVASKFGDEDLFFKHMRMRKL